MRLVTLPGVFTPISDSRMLADALRRETLPPGARVLDLCTGSGILAVTAALRGADATAVDVSRRAVLTARLNARLNGVRVRGVRGDLFAAVEHEKFDCIVSNPPYVPSERPELPTRGASRAWEAGPDGRVVLDRICAEAAAHLRPGGVVLLTQSDIVGEQETLDALRAAGLRAATIERRRSPLGPLMRDRVRRGLLPEDLREEDVLIIRGQLIAANSGMNGTAPLAHTRPLDVDSLSTRS
ncbi:MAG TPA: HemK2/MTQ2 family protein methyltransferase [Solirubrobacteraceae bacterium]|nr:HemK2/MTQ2 family protein methyltransferase [Solirubrobacteraceae bacterium]